MSSIEMDSIELEYGREVDAIAMAQSLLSVAWQIIENLGFAEVSNPGDVLDVRERIEIAEHAAGSYLEQLIDDGEQPTVKTLTGAY